MAQFPNLKHGEPELIIVFNPDAEVRHSVSGLQAPSADISNVQSILDNNNASIQLLFGLDENRLRQQQSKVAAAALSVTDEATSNVPDLASFYHVQAPADKLQELATQLFADPQVEAAYVKPPGSPPVVLQDPLKPSAVPAAPPAAGDAPAVTPNFIDRQGYLGAAPAGIEAIPFAHDRVGGQGEKVRIIDCEWGWLFTHEDLTENQGGIIAGQNYTELDFINHGTAVAGEIGGDRNNYGITGIVPRATFSASSFIGQSSSQAIKAAADKLGPGDVILLEIHRPGPNTPPDNPSWSQAGFIAVEWWYDDFAAIQYAVAKGIVVVEAAGNGAQNLDDPIYETPPVGSPPGFKNPFNPNNPSSGAVLVGAGAPPSGNYGPDRSRCDFSNYGQRVDAQGWGREVVTTGYGDLQTGANQNLWYTQYFSGTSSASPIITGALGAVSGILKDFDRRPLTSPQAIKLLRSTGSPQQDGWNGPATQRIGNRPNLKQLIPAALGTA